MTGSNKTILVLGATGTQGGAVARRLLADGWTVRALTRDPRSAKARELADAGAEVVAGDAAVRSSMDAAVKGAHGVFSVQATLGQPGVPADFDEVAAGRNVADAAAAAGVRHFVFASVLNADRETGVPLLDNKGAIERHLATLDLSTTVLRISSLMENHVHPQMGLQGGALVTPVRADVPMQSIAADDIAAFATFAFADPDAHRGRVIELAGDELTPVATAAAISAAVGRDVPYTPIPVETLRALDEKTARAFDFLNSGKTSRADIAALRGEYPGLLSFPAWLEAKGAAAITAHLDATTG